MSGKSIIEKLLIKPGYKVQLVNAPKGFLETIGKFPVKVDLLMKDERGADFIQAFVYNCRELAECVNKIKPRLTTSTVFWLTYLKGTAKTKTDINRDTINDYLKSVGLQIVSMISVDSDWSAARVKFIL